MSLSAGARVGPYEIVSALGAGGMGEVYRARDTKLHRDVAIKVLPDSLAADPGRLARFEREAKTLAALNHPHIAHIHGFEDSTGTPALVMELVEGPTLADRIAHSSIPVDEALPIARQIAEALEAAHEQGIIHRDLKPANIKVRTDGTVKVLDFGLAKVMEPAGAISPAVSQSPTITTPALMTGVGVILGTAAYMAPEQARGHAADRRSDVWAFGCVLYEMLTGRRAFDGEDLSDTLAAVLRGSPDWTALPPTTPPSILRLLRRCLEKDRKRRLDSSADAGLEIEEALTAPPPVVVPRNGRKRFAWIIAAVAIVAGIVVAATIRGRGRPLSTAADLLGTTFRFSVAPPPGSHFIGTVGGNSYSAWQFAVSPDGRWMVFGATTPGKRDVLWIRPFNGTDARPLAGTEGARFPFWAPDSRRVAFFKNDLLQKIDISGGPPQTICQTTFLESRPPRGGTWQRTGVILMGSDHSLMRVSDAGGSVAVLSDTNQDAELFPSFLPDANHFVYLARSSQPEKSGIFVGSLDSPKRVRLVEANWNAAYVSPGYLLYVRGQALLAQAVDTTAWRLTGDPVPVTESVAASGLGYAAFSASQGGILAYAPAVADVMQPVWMDRAGTSLGPVGAVPGPIDLHELSRDQNQALLTRSDLPNATRTVWAYDLRRSAEIKIAVGADAIFSPDGRQIAFNVGPLEAGNFQAQGMFRRAVAGEGFPEPLVVGRGSAWPTDWSIDGRYILYQRFGSPKTGLDIVVYDTSTGSSKPFLETTAPEGRARFSPDQRWVAYVSADSGRNEVYIRPFSGSGSRLLVSNAGGGNPYWRSDGKELFYQRSDGDIMAVAVDSHQDSLAVGLPKLLFHPRVRLPQAAAGMFGGSYVPAGDGNRFLVNELVQDSDATPITVVVNWMEELKQKVPLK